MLRAWNESCQIFLDIIKSSPSSPFKNVSSLFARHEFQSQADNLPHIHTMIKIYWNSLTNQEKQFFNDCIRAGVLDIVKVHEMQRLVDEGLLNDVCEVSKITNLAKKILSHKCTPRCLVMIGENKFVCRKPNYSKMNNPPGNPSEKYEILPNDMSLESLRQLEKVEIINPLEYDNEKDFLKPFKSRLSYFHPK